MAKAHYTPTNPLVLEAGAGGAGGGAGGHVQRAERGKHAVGVCEAGGCWSWRGGRRRWLTRSTRSPAWSGKHAVGVCDDGAGARGESVCCLLED